MHCWTRYIPVQPRREPVSCPLPMSASRCEPPSCLQPFAALQQEDIDRLFKEVVDKWGTVEVLVRGAGSKWACRCNSAPCADWAQSALHVAAEIYCEVGVHVVVLRCDQASVGLSLRRLKLRCLRALCPTHTLSRAARRWSCR